jgi:hypothetical protein
MRKGIRRNVREWSEAGLSLVRSPVSTRYLRQWLHSTRFPHRDTPLAWHLPYMPYSVTTWLDRWLKPDMTAFEYGAGGSTLWLAKRVERLTSVEHHRDWYQSVQAELARNGIENCTLELREPEDLGPHGAESRFASEVVPATFEAYVRTVEAFADESLDVVLIDGRSRSAALEAAREKVRRGGVLVLDDSDRERYQPAQRCLDTWPRKTFYGVKPFVVKPAVTTLWMKPG